MEHHLRQFTTITNNVRETQNFAKSFAKKIIPGTVILLSGELGSGKTSFTQGLAEALGITQRIISPTFLIIRTYNVLFSKKDITHLYHIDLYRVDTEHDLGTLGIDDVLQENEAILIIEWPEKLGALRPKKYWQLNFEHISDKKRKITGTYNDH